MPALFTHTPSVSGKRLPRSLSAVLVLLTILNSGCSAFNCTKFETLLGTDTDLISFSYTIAEKLVASALPPLVPHHPDMPVLVTTLVDNSDLNQTSAFGRVLQEHIASRFVQLGYTVREVKLADTLHIEPRSGETMLTRDPSEIRKSQQAQAILVGTVSRANRILYISARLVDPANNNILATDDYKICMDTEILAMFGLRRQNVSDSPVREPSQPLLNSIL